MSQRSDVSNKYEFFYEVIDTFVADTLRASKAPPEQLYGKLKLYAEALPFTANWALSKPGGVFPSKDEQRIYAENYLRAPLTWIERGVTKTATRADYIRATSSLFAQTIRQYVGGCDLILDLGCGWGHRMIDLHLAGQASAFYGGDRSQHCGNIIANLAKLFPAAAPTWFKFDFLNPDFSPVPGHFKRVGVYTTWAIEQVTGIGNGLFDALLQKFPDAEIAGVHLEPISFQIDPGRTAEKEYAVARQYNLDLLSAVSNHPALSVLHKEAIVIDAGDLNPAALLAWKRRT